MSGEATAVPLAAPDGSRLCLACGICCQGALHERVRVDADEVGQVEALGLRVYPGKETLVFDLPCPHHREDRCTVYDRRPHSCSSYRCKLLRRYLGGEIGLEESLKVVGKARELLAGISRRLDAIGDGAAAAEPQAGIWRRLRERTLGAAEDDPDLLLAVASLLALAQGHFKNRAEPVRTLGALGIK